MAVRPLLQRLGVTALMLAASGCNIYNSELIASVSVASIDASSDGTSDGGSLVAPNATLNALTVTPSTPPAIGLGSNLSFQATGTYSDGTNRDVSDVCTWVSTTANASISQTGIATGLASGTSTIYVTYEGVTSSQVSLSVLGTPPTSISITPVNPGTLLDAQSIQFNATAIYPDQAPADVTNNVTWMSGDSTVLTVHPSGLATGALAGTTPSGTTTIGATLTIASFGTWTAPTVTVTVNNPITNLAISPSINSQATLPMPTSTQFNVEATYASMLQIALTNGVTWNSSNTGVMTVASSGLATSVSPGSSILTAVVVNDGGAAFMFDGGALAPPHRLPSTLRPKLIPPRSTGRT